MSSNLGGILLPPAPLILIQSAFFVARPIRSHNLGGWGCVRQIEDCAGPGRVAYYYGDAWKWAPRIMGLVTAGRFERRQLGAENQEYLLKGMI